MLSVAQTREIQPTTAIVTSKSDRLSCFCQVNNLDLLAELKTMTGFLIYDWIERPDKQAVIQEPLDLLIKKVLVPSAGA